MQIQTYDDQGRLLGVSDPDALVEMNNEGVAEGFTKVRCLYTGGIGPHIKCVKEEDFKAFDKGGL